jgi:Outer membrane protein beta-barrel domain
MHALIARNLLDLYRDKISNLAHTTFGNCFRLIPALAFCLLFVGTQNQTLSAQKRSNLNYEGYSHRDFYFGISLALNQSKYHLTQASRFIQNDSILIIESKNGGGFNIGLVTNFEFGDNFDVRFPLPTFSFAKRDLIYKTTGREEITKTINSVLLEFPVHFRYKSAPYRDTRLFVVLGGRYSVDLASNSKDRNAQGLIKILPNDFAIEYGFGFQIFFPFFILSPEIKFSHGIMNIHNRQDGLIYSSLIDKLFSRGFAITFHFEG